MPIALCLVIVLGGFLWTTTYEPNAPENVVDCHEGSSTDPTRVVDRADFNNDGHNDLVDDSPDGHEGDAPTYIEVTYGSPTGTEQWRQKIEPDSGELPPDLPGNTKFDEGVTAGDLDGDGYTDLAVETRSEDSRARTYGHLILWGSDNGLKEGVHQELSDMETLDASPTTGDFVGDNNTDLVWLAEDGFVLEQGPFSRDGKPAKRKQTSKGIDANGDLADLAAGDMTGDGKDDLVSFYTYTEDMFALRPHFYRGTLQGLRKFDVKIPTGSRGKIRDHDGDGYGDLLMAAYVDQEFASTCQLRAVYGSEGGPNEDRSPTGLDPGSPDVPDF